MSGTFLIGGAKKLGKINEPKEIFSIGYVV